MCLNDLLALGGGGNYALCLEEDLLSGTSGPSDTFGNKCLAHSPEFELKNVELTKLKQIIKWLSSPAGCSSILYIYILH
ncbi:hypothetical protein JHK82_028608 [Glycine max]|nr:hypothetical protein JHK82_028608 [Glycine max]KAG5152386.1 hypothetical protein JHK84_028858 [Glycine max]